MPDQPEYPSVKEYRDKLAEKVRTLRKGGEKTRARFEIIKEKRDGAYTLANALRKEPARLPNRQSFAKDDSNVRQEGFLYDELISNEFSLHEVFPYLKEVTGAGIGVGLDQMLDIAANSKLERVYLLDIYSPTVLATRALLEAGKRYRELHGRYPTKDEFLKLFTKELLPLTLDMVKKNFFDTEMPRVTHALTRSTTKLPGGPPLIEVYLHFKASQKGYPSWISNDENLTRVLTMYEEGRIQSVHGDMTGETAIRKIADELKDEKMPLTLAYLSNMQDYFSSRAGEGLHRRLRESLSTLPVDQDTLILWTEGMGVTMTQPEQHAADDPYMRQKAGGWQYVLQRFGDILLERNGAYMGRDDTGVPYPLDLTGRIHRVLSSSEDADAMNVLIPKQGVVIAGLNAPAVKES